jgi:signal transduction histidine kinase
MVLVALVVAGAGVAAALYGALMDDIDDAAEDRLNAVATNLLRTGVADLPDALLGTNNRIAAVQIIATDGAVVRESTGSAPTPLVSIAELEKALASGEPQSLPGRADLRITARTVEGADGTYAVVIGTGREIVGSTMVTVATTLGVIAPIVTAVSAVATYRLVRRSMRSVDEIRSRVADISTHDLTERVPVPQSRDEIAALAVTMNEMLTRVEAGHAAQRRFVGDASHELRSPLATIISALEVAEAHPEVLTNDVAATTLMTEAHRMQSLVEDLLLLARADEHAILARHDDVDLDHLVTSEVERLQGKTALAVHARVCPTRIAGDADALARVLRNLLDNAERHARSRVELDVDHNAECAVVTIGDDGPGIPATDRARVFGRFVRLDSDRSRSAGGAGLGLAIVSEIVAAHGGSVTLDDRPRGGVVVTLQFPLTYSPDSRR